MASKRSIESFLSCRRIAVVGVSREARDFSRSVFRAFVERGYDAVPVNPNGGEAEGRPFARRLQDVSPPVEGAYLITPPAATLEAVRDCAEAGVTRVWMHRGGGQGAVDPEAVALCRETGIELVEGECPLMFLPGTGFVHGVHRFFRRLAGSLPR
jgi:uncharacterized protein